MEIIDELEKEKRGLYAGSVGYFSAAGEMDTCIVLRTALVKDGVMYVQAGAGIVADSDPDSEQQECVNKAKALFRAAEEARRFASAGAARSASEDAAMSSDHRHCTDMEARRRAGDPGQFARSQHRADARHGPQGRDQPRPRRRAEDLGRHGHASSPNAKTGAHHHGALESVIYVVRGKARMRWGEQLEFVAEAGPGDFIYVPPYVPHQEINASPDEPLECVLVRSDNEAVVVNLDIEPVEKPEDVSLDRPDPQGLISARSGQERRRLDPRIGGV